MRALMLLAAVTIALAPRYARADDLQKIAVLIVGATPTDAEVADNLTEVIIARVAQTRGVQIAGTTEFRKRLGIQSENRARICLEDAACIATVAVSLGVTKIVSGSVAARDKQFLFSLVLRDMNTGEIEKRIFRLVDGDVDELVAAAQQATSELFVPPPAPGHVHVGSEPAGARVSIDEAYVGRTPLISGNLVAGKHALRVEAAGHFPWSSNVDVPAGTNLEINLTPQNLPPRLQWPTTVATGLTALAVATAATGGVLGVLAQVEPTSPNRAVAQEEFEHRRRLGLAADISFVGAAVIGASAVVVYWVYRRHIFGETGASRPGSPPGLD